MMRMNNHERKLGCTMRSNWHSHTVLAQSADVRFPFDFYRLRRRLLRAGSLSPAFSVRVRDDTHNKSLSGNNTFRRP